MTVRLIVQYISNYFSEYEIIEGLDCPPIAFFL